MRFFGTVIAWLGASAVAYLVAAVASQTMVLNTTAKLLKDAGQSLPLSTRLESTLSAVTGLWALLPVIAIGFLVAFFVARLAKAALPFLAPFAYPAAGAAAMATILGMIPVAIPAYDGLPGTGTTLGVALQLAAGAVGGFVFEMFRPRR